MNRTLYEPKLENPTTPDDEIFYLMMCRVCKVRWIEGEDDVNDCPYCSAHFARQDVIYNNQNSLGVLIIYNERSL